MAKKAKAKRAEHVEQVVEDVIVTPEKRKAKAEPINLSKGQSDEYAGLLTKSAKIRYLSAEGFSVSQVAEHLNIRYQHVRNVLTTPLKRAAAAE